MNLTPDMRTSQIARQMGVLERAGTKRWGTLPYRQELVITLIHSCHSRCVARVNSQIEEYKRKNNQPDKNPEEGKDHKMMK